MSGIITEKYNDVVVAFFQESSILDERNIQDLSDALFDIVDRHYHIRLLLNFEIVEYLSSAVLGKLVALQKKITQEKGKLKLCCIRPQVYEVFKVTKLNKVLDIYETQDEAMEAYAGRGLFGFGKKKKK